MRSIIALVAVTAACGLAAAADGCNDDTTGSGGAGTGNGGSTASTVSGPTVTTGPFGVFCNMPGSLQFTEKGKVRVPGGSSAAPDLQFLTLPTGFCAHWFGNIGNPRQLRFSPSAELFVASPTKATTGGGPNGQSAIVILPDSNHDGYADAPITYLPSLAATQGMLFTPGYFYYQDSTKIMRVAYKPGDHAPSGASEQVADIAIYSSDLHWPKTLDVADDGTIYVGNGGDQNELCDATHPFHGGILKLDGTPGGTPVAKGLRNPIGVRCAKGHNVCFAVELAKDYTQTEGGREKLIPIRQGDDWGFPCCATKDLPYMDVSPTPDCSGVVPEAASFVIGNTPFAFDFEPGNWAAPWKGSAFIPLHGTAGNWVGARLVAVAMDPTTGLPLPSTNLSGMPSGGMSDFASGWDDGTQAHGRPAAVAFSPDGRLFLANDTTGDIVWIAPMGLQGS